MREMTLIILVSLAVFILTGCKGIVTGREYTDEDILRIATFSGESVERVKFALSNPSDVNLSEMAKSLERIDMAVKEINRIRDE